MASGGGGSAKISSGALKGKVAYFSEGEIKAMGAKAGLSYADAFAAMKAGDNAKLNAIIKNSVTVFDVKDSQATKNEATGAKFAADQAAQAKLAANEKKIQEAAAVSNAYVDVSYDPDATGAKYTVKNKATGEVSPGYSLGSAMIKAENAEKAFKSAQGNKNAELLSKDAKGTGLSVTYSTNSEGYIVEGGNMGVEYFDNVSAAQAYVIQAKERQADKLDKQAQQLNSGYLVAYESATGEYELYRLDDKVATHSTAAEMQIELDDLKELIDASNAPAASITPAAPAAPAAPKAPKAKVVGINKNQAIMLPGTLPGLAKQKEDIALTGDVYGDFIVHKSSQVPGGAPNGFTITHIPTGYFIGTPTSKEHATSVTAKLLEIDGLDWSSTNPIGTATPEAKSQAKKLGDATYTGEYKGAGLVPTAVPGTTAVSFGAIIPDASTTGTPKPKKAPKAKANDAPALPSMDVGSLVTVKSLGGSTGASLVRDPSTGQSYVKKSGKTAAHIEEEMTADTLYGVLGVAVPAFQSSTEGGSPVKLSTYLPNGTPLSSILNSGGAQAASVRQQVQQGFVADALLGNWDVVGLSFDNILVQDGTAYRVDTGGSLRYRAQGNEKPNFNGVPMELWTLRNAEQNETAASIFGGISLSAIAAQIDAVTAKKSALLKQTPVSLKGVLKERMENLAYIAGAIKRLQKTGASDAAIDTYLRKVMERLASGGTKPSLTQLAQDFAD